MLTQASRPLDEVYCIVFDTICEPKLECEAKEKVERRRAKVWTRLTA